MENWNCFADSPHWQGGYEMQQVVEGGLRCIGMADERVAEQWPFEKVNTCNRYICNYNDKKSIRSGTYFSLLYLALGY